MKSGSSEKPIASKRGDIFRNKWVLIGSIVAVLFVAGVVGAWFYMSYRQSAAEGEKVAATEEVNQTIDSADKLASSGKTDDAMAAYDDAINSTDNPDDKVYLYINKATALFNNKKYDEALTTMKEAEAVGEYLGVAYLIAQIYEKKGDTENAIKYYEKTVALVDERSPVAEDDIAVYQSKVDELKGKQ